MAAGVFFDEIATLSEAAQIALLRVLENQVVRPVGDSEERKINLRIVSATNEDLKIKVQNGEFRQDLWSRLCEATIAIPPLRERRDEISSLCTTLCADMRGGPFAITASTIEILSQYSWAVGNIRELRNCLRAMTENAIGQRLTPACIPERIWAALEAGDRPARNSVTGADVIQLELGDSWQYQELCFRAASSSDRKNLD